MMIKKWMLGIGLFGAVLTAVLLLPGKSIDVRTEPESAPERQNEHVFEAIVTAYSSSPDETDDTPEIMASGKKVYPGAVACPRRIEFGVEVEIEGRRYTCEDRMHPRFDDRFDVWHPSKDEAWEWGKKKVLVRVLTD